jgi:outer membrane lipoprotein carrier protein
LKALVKSFLFGLYILASSAYGLDSKDLSKNLKNLNNIEARFVQHTHDGQGALLQTQSGQIFLKHPNKFRWESEPPYQQLLLTNGETLWQYDEDLEQVSVQKLDQRISSTPALLLSGNDQHLNSEYDIYAEELQNEEHFVLIPKRADSLFDRLRMEFNEQGQLVRMVIKDEVGQKTVIRLSNYKTGKALSNELFNFVPPEGVDVLSSDF